MLDLALRAVQHLIGHEFDSFAPRTRIGLIRAPILLVHGSADTVVPIDSIDELAAAQPNAEILVIPDGGHSDMEHFEHHVDEIIDFFHRQMPRSSR